MYGPELQAQIEQWKAKSAKGELTQADNKAIFEALRAARGKIPAATGGSRVTKAKKAAAAKPNGDDLLSELEGM